MKIYQPLQEQAYDHLKELIVSGALEYDKIYSEAKIAAQLGMSRTPVKDALVRLSQAKYIDIIPSKGFCLHVFSIKDIWDTYQVRTAIEGFCALNLANNKDSYENRSRIHLMEETLREMQLIVDSTNNIETFFDFDIQFHSILVSSSNNREIIELFDSLNYRISSLSVKSLAEPMRLENTCSEHQLIIDSIKMCAGHNDMGPYKAVQHHTEATREITLSLMEHIT